MNFFKTKTRTPPDLVRGLRDAINRLEAGAPGGETRRKVCETFSLKLDPHRSGCYWWPRSYAWSSFRPARTWPRIFNISRQSSMAMEVSQYLTTIYPKWLNILMKFKKNQPRSSWHNSHRKHTIPTCFSSWSRTSHDSSLRRGKTLCKYSTTFSDDRLDHGGQLLNTCRGSLMWYLLLWRGTKTRRWHWTQGWFWRRCWGMNSCAKYCSTPISERYNSSSLPRSNSFFADSTNSRTTLKRRRSAYPAMRLQISRRRWHDINLWWQNI